SRVVRVVQILPVERDAGRDRRRPEETTALGCDDVGDEVTRCCERGLGSAGRELSECESQRHQQSWCASSWTFHVYLRCGVGMCDRPRPRQSECRWKRRWI